MSDFVPITPGVGADIAVDDIAGRKFQRVKLTFGADGSAVDVSAADPVPVTGPLSDVQLRASPVPVTGPLTDAQLRAAALPVSAASLPLPAGAATQATLAAVDAKLPVLATRPLDNEAAAVPVRPIGQEVWNCSFSGVGASVIAPQFIAPIVGTGVGFSQAGGALLVTSGTTANAEFLTRSVVAWRGAMRLRYSTVLSQRIVNNNFAVLLADLVGAGLSFTINSATSVTVTSVAHGLTTQNVGQFMLLGGIVGAAGVPGRYAIASVPTVDTITFTVAGWPASGSGTLTLFGHSYVRNLYTGTTATNVSVDAQRLGWASGDTTATINTTASPGHILQAELTGRDVFWSDTLRISTGTPAFTSRASRYENIPDDNLDLYVWLWSFNGTVAPASTTTWTLSYCAVEKFANTPVYLQGVRANGSINALPIAGSVTVSGTVTANQGTMVALPAGTNAVGDVGIQVRANATGAASIHHIVSAASTNVVQIKGTAGRVFGYCLSNNTASWRYVKLHNIASATAGSGVVMTIGIPPNGKAESSIPAGIGFATAISRSIVAGAADANAVAIGAEEVVGDIFFA